MPFERVRFITRYSPAPTCSTSTNINNNASNANVPYVGDQTTDSSDKLTIWCLLAQADEEVASDLNDSGQQLDSMKQLTMNRRSAGVTNNFGEQGLASPSTPIMDMNMYATRKTIAQGIMDLGLMCANASQLKCKTKGFSSILWCSNRLSLQMFCWTLRTTDTFKSQFPWLSFQSFFK